MSLRWWRETITRLDLDAFGALATIAMLVLLALASVVCLLAPLWVR